MPVAKGHRMWQGAGTTLFHSLSVCPALRRGPGSVQVAWLYQIKDPLGSFWGRHPFPLPLHMLARPLLHAPSVSCLASRPWQNVGFQGGKFRLSLFPVWRYSHFYRCGRFCRWRHLRCQNDHCDLIGTHANPFPIPIQTECTVPLLFFSSLDCSFTADSKSVQHIESFSTKLPLIRTHHRTKVVLVESSYCKPLPPRILLSTWFWLGLPHHFSGVNSLFKFGEGNTKTCSTHWPKDKKEWNREADQN